MAFKTAKTYNEERFGGFFLLRNDNDYADVIFLYQSGDDVLVADTHYIKSDSYSGYVHCCGKGCPACAKDIRVQTKLFIPLYNISEGEIQYFDRTMRFEPQLQKDVFTNYANPSQYVFRITRHGAAGSMDTYYEITAIGKNSSKSYDTILAENNAVMPDHYNNVCKEVSIPELQTMLATSSSATGQSHGTNGQLADYQVQPRQSATAFHQPPVAEPEVNLVDAVPFDMEPDNAATFTEVPNADIPDGLDDDQVEF